MKARSDLVEGMAVVAAAACLAHCLALPLLLAALPALSVAMPLPASFHVLALAVAVPTTSAALWLGYRHHGMPTPFAVGLSGLFLIALGATRFGETVLEVPITVAGSLLITGAHLANWRLRRRAHSHELA